MPLRLTQVRQRKAPPSGPSAAIVTGAYKQKFDLLVSTFFHFTLNSLMEKTFKLWLEAEEEWGDGEHDDFANDSGENFWGNVGAGVLPIAKSTGRILLSFRSAYVNEPNTWGIWGGKVNDEDVMDLQSEAKREFMEESGYSGSIQLTPAYIFKTSGFEYHNFIGVIPDEFEPNIPPQHQWETEGHEWMTFEEVMSVDPKHFGLAGLLQHSGSAIQKLTQR